MLKYHLSLFIGVGMACSTFAQASELPVIGDERAMTVRLSQTQAANMATKDLVRHGEKLFDARFTVLDGAGRPLATNAEVPTKRELGNTPAFFRTSGPEANACSGCHAQPESGGAGDFVTNVFAADGVGDAAEFDTLDAQFSNERGTPPVHGSGLVELLAREMSADLQKLRNTGVDKARSSGEAQVINLESKGVSFGQLTANPDGFIDISEIDGIDFDLVVRPFSQKGVFTSLRQFSINAMNAHHGMQAPERYGAQWTNTADFDGDGYMDETSIGDITAMVAYQATLPTPKQVMPTHPILVDAAIRGEAAFNDMGCNTCHRNFLPLANLTFSEPSPYNNAGNLRPSDNEPSVEFDLSSFGLKQDDQGNWLVPLFSDLKRHVIADDAHSYFVNELLGQRYIPRDVFISAKLWTVGNTAPYGHRGDITTMREAILHHGGDANEERTAFEQAGDATQADVIEFLKSLQVVERGAS